MDMTCCSFPDRFCNIKRFNIHSNFKKINYCFTSPFMESDIIPLGKVCTITAKFVQIMYNPGT